MQGNLFYGCGTALVTPFKGNRIDFDAMEALIDWQLDEGTDAIVVLGTTGEPETVSDSERSAVIECAAVGLPVGLGDALFGGLESALSAALFGIPAVKGVSFGSGFEAANLRGSQNNDPYILKEGRVATATNHAGGIAGGMTTGMPLICKAAFKPTPSIGLPQRSVNLDAMEETELVITGRHDPCVVPRAVPVVEAVTALVLMDKLL